MSLKITKKNNAGRDGFTILVAAVTASILLVIAMSIGGIALKEKILSTSGKESQIAFYAADAAMECALYLDQKLGAFAPTQDGETPNSALVGCNNNPRVGIEPDRNPPFGTYSFSFIVEDIKVGAGSDTTCGQVVVNK